MKQHFCPAEQSMIAFEKECNWCGELESQEPVAVFYLPIRKDMRKDVEALIDHAKRARWTNVVVRKDAVETTYEADWIKELIPYTHPPKRKWVGLTDSQRKEIKRQSVYVDGAIRMTEAKLKENNI
jgi:hypothetical protein